MMLTWQHAQVWALDVGGEAESLLVTGGADARVAVWRDCTAADAAAAAAGAAEAALKAQQLSNALQARLPCRALRAMRWACAAPALHVMSCTLRFHASGVVACIWGGCFSCKSPHSSCFKCPVRS